MTVPPAVLLLAVVGVPGLVAAALLLLGRRADRAAGWTAAGVAGLVLVLSAGAAATRPSVTVPFLGLVPGGGLGLGVDGLSAVLSLTVAAVTLAVLVFAAVDVEQRQARFGGWMLLFSAAMQLTVTATTFPALLLGWEVMGATSYALIGFRWREAGTVPAATTAFVTTRAADLGLYLAAGATLAGTGGLVLADLGRDGTGSGWASWASAGVLVAALGKSAQLPFSAWLSGAMLGPSPVSALLHSATMVAAGGYLLLRLQPLLAQVGWAASAAAWAGAATAVVMGAVAVAQTDLKQLLAASTSAQLGFVVLAAGVGATAGGAMHLVAHAVVKATVFVAAGVWLTSLGTRRLEGLRGAARRHPVVGGAATVAVLALAGLPPLPLWSTKDTVLAGVTGPALAATTLLAVGLAAAYAGKVLLVVLDDRAPAGDLDDERPGTRTVPLPASAAAAVLAAVVVGLSLLAFPPVARALARTVGARGEELPGVGSLLLSAGIVLAVLVAVRSVPSLVRAPERSPLAGWAGLGRLLDARPVLGLARAAAWADDHALDAVVRAAPTPVRALARATARLDDGVVDGAVVATARSARALGRGTAVLDTGVVDGLVRGTAALLWWAGAAARRLQTGMVHQYYAMAAVGLGALLALVLLG